MVIVRARLEPEAGAVLMQALAAAREKVFQPAVPAGTSTVGVGNEPPTWGQLQADALTLLAETALHQGMDPGAAGERFQVVVHLDAAVLADADAPGQAVVEGARVSAETSQRLACDASRVVTRHDGNGNITEVGARTRTIPPALRRALLHRDQVVDFQVAARDSVKAITSAHRAVHEDGFQVTRESNGELSFRTPLGRPLPVVAPPAPAPLAPVAALRRHYDVLGVHIDAHLDADLGGRAAGSRVRDLAGPSARVSAFDQALFELTARQIRQPSHSQTPRPMTHSRS